MKNERKILLVQPEFPISNKSYYYKDYLPIGLLKIASYLKNYESIKKIMLVYGMKPKDLIKSKIGYPTDIYITSLFTYWASYCYEAINYYSELFPHATIHFGGIYVSLMFDYVRQKIADLFPNRKIEMTQGIVNEVEFSNWEHGPLLSLLPNYQNIDFIIIHAMRGCPRKCDFCGTHIIEPENTYRNAECLEKYILMITHKYPNIKRLVFYDNNFLKNPNIILILRMLTELTVKGIIRECESQSGFDGRLLNQELANGLKSAKFIHPRIAWDGKYVLKDNISDQIQYLINAGYDRKELSVFMLYNWDLCFDVMINKVKCCIDWKVQIADCRLRPINLDKQDGYNPRKIHGQNKDDYYIHDNWKDWQVRLFRKIVRKANIMTRMNWNNMQYSQWMRHQKIEKDSEGSSSDFIDADILNYKIWY